MPRWAAPKATKVATSKQRTRMMSRSGWLVAKRSCARSRDRRRPARARCRRAAAAASPPSGCGPWAAPGPASRSASLADSDRRSSNATRRPVGIATACGQSTGWAGCHWVGQGSPRSSKWHASRSISSRIARAAGEHAAMTEPSRLGADGQQLEHAVEARSRGRCRGGGPPSRSSKTQGANGVRQSGRLGRSRSAAPSGSGWRPARSAARRRR